MHQLWEKIKPKGDRTMWIIIIVMMLWGLLAVYSSVGALAYKKSGGNTEWYLLQQVFYLGVGFLIMLVLHSIHYKYYLSISRILLLISYVLLIMTLLFGVEINGARRWLSIMGITMQTSDFSKVALILYITRTLSKRQNEVGDMKKVFFPIVIHVSITCLLIAPENLSTAIILFGTSMLVMFLGRVQLKHLGMLGLGLLLAGGLLVFTLFLMPESLMRGRMLTWKHRIERFVGNDSSTKIQAKNADETYQNDHAKIAIAGGGFWGKHPGNSTERNFLPEAYSDFIYAIIAEEYGFVGAVFLLILYLTFLFRILRIVRNSPHAFGALVAAGLGFAIVTQAIFNMGVAVDLLPNTGLTLPLISKGGTAIFFTSIAFGVIMSVSRHVEFMEPEPPIDKIDAAKNTIQELEPIAV